MESRTQGVRKPLKGEACHLRFSQWVKAGVFAKPSG